MENVGDEEQKPSAGSPPTDAEMDQLIRACCRWNHREGLPKNDPAVRRFLSRAANPQLALFRLELFLAAGRAAARRAERPSG